MKSINDVFTDWINLQTGGKDALDPKVPAWLAINNGIEGGTIIHSTIRKFFDGRISAAGLEWNPLDEHHQHKLYVLQEQFKNINRLCRESVSDNDFETYKVLHA